MSDPTPLLRAAEESIDQQGELPAANRLELHRGLDELLSAIHPNAGHLTRARLGLVCALSGLHLVDRYPDLHAAATLILETSELALQGQYDTDALEADNEALHAQATALMQLDAPFVPALYAGLACKAAVDVVLYDSDFETLGVDEKVAPPDEWDPAFYASLAHSGGAVWEAVGDNHVRQAFWRWYLNDAVPFAWDATRPMSTYPPLP